MPRRSQRSRGRERQEVAMPVLRLRRSEPASCGCTGLPLPALLNLPAFSTGTIGPHTQGRAHRFPPYWRGALPAAWTNPESRRHSIPTPQPYPSLTLALALAIAGAGTVHTPLERDQGHPLVLGAVHLARHAALVRRLDGCATRTARVRTAAHWGRTRWPMAAIPTEAGAAGGHTKYGVAARLRLRT